MIFVGFTCLENKVIPEPQETDKKKVPRFFMPISQRKKSFNCHLGLGQRNIKNNKQNGTTI